MLAMIGLLASVTIAPMHAGARTSTISLVKTVRTSSWSRPSPDPTGLTFRPGTRELLVSDSEVDEIPGLWAGRNMWSSGALGNGRRAGRLTEATHEPEDLAWYPRNRVLYACDDDKDMVFGIKSGPDHRFGSLDDRSAVVLKTRRFGSGDPEGMTYVSFKGALVIADDSAQRIYKVRRGPDRKFGSGDDIVRSFSTPPLGIDHPEGVAFQPGTRSLFIVGYPQSMVAVTTLTGRLVRKIDLTPYGLIHPSAIEIAPRAPGHPRSLLYVLDRGLDNNSHPRENDGRLFIFRLG